MNYSLEKIAFKSLYFCGLLLALLYVTFFTLVHDANAQMCYQHEIFCCGTLGCDSISSGPTSNPTPPTCGLGWSPWPGQSPRTFSLNNAMCGLPAAENCVGSWSAWSTCTPKGGETCGAGNGTQLRTYRIISPAQYGGAACPVSNGTLENRDCNLGSCTLPPVDCAGYWSNSGSCSASCGGGQQSQNFVVTQAPQNGGAACPSSPRTVSCNTQSCASPVVNCAGYWSNVGSCSNSCGLGLQQRNFTVTRAPSGGGSSCPYSPEYVVCLGTSSCVMPNQLPNVNAGPDLDITLPTDGVSVVGASASDPDGFITSVDWTRVSGPMTYNIVGGDTMRPDFSGLSNSGNYTFRLTVTDNSGASRSDDLNVMVNPNPSPTNIDLAVGPLSATASDETDLINGTYDSVRVLIGIQNNGPINLPANSNIAYLASLNAVNSAIGTYPGVIAQSDNAIVWRDFADVSAGDYTVCARVNLDGSPNYPEDAVDLANNEKCIPTSFSLAAVPPDMGISVSKSLIRSGDSIDVEWFAHTSYPVTCEVSGAGGVTDTFLANQNHPTGEYRNSSNGIIIEKASQFSITCDTGLGAPFTKTATVEVVPNFEEI